MNLKNILLLISKFLMNSTVFVVIMGINQELLFLEQNFVPQFIVFVSFQLLFIFSTSQLAFFTKFRKESVRISVGVLGLFAVYIIYSIVLIPFEMYVYWIKLLQSGSQGGAISGLSVWGQIFCICLFTGLTYYKKYLVSILGMLLSQCIMFSIFYHNFILYCTTTGLIIITSLCVFLSNKKDDAKAATYSYYLIQIGAILIVSFLLSLYIPLYKGWLGTMSLLPELHQFFSNDFPVSPIISTVGDVNGQVSSSDLGYNNFSKKPIFKINGKNNIPYYIRVSSHVHYTTNSWYNSFNELEVKDNAIIHFDQGVDNPDFEISLLADYYLQIPHTLMTEKVTILDTNTRKFQFASFDYGFKFDLPLTGSKKIQIKEYKEKTSEITKLSEEEEREYLYIPWDVKDSLLTLLDTNELNQQRFNEKIESILKFLRNNYTYSLKIPSTNRKKDGVIQFLKVNKQGYCQHFSSAFIFMARLCRIPSRYITGYYGIIPGGEESVILTGFSAHAWAEVWLPGTGWKTIEATPPLSLNRPEQMSMISKMKDSATKKQLMNLLQVQISQIEGDRSLYKNYLKTGTLTALLVLAFGGIIILVMKMKQWRFIKTREDKIINIYKSIIKKNQKKGISGPEILGWKKWAESLGSRQNLSHPEIQQLIDIAYSCFFTPRQTKQEEINQLKNIKKNV